MLCSDCAAQVPVFCTALSLTEAEKDVQFLKSLGCCVTMEPTNNPFTTLVRHFNMPMGSGCNVEEVWWAAWAEEKPMPDVGPYISCKWEVVGRCAYLYAFEGRS